jgi:type I restriction enzyme M protein
MLDNGTKTRINNARDILVGKVPDPKAQVEQITTALIYKFMHDMDQESVELGGKAAFFVEEYAQYDWAKLIDTSLSGQQRLDLYVRALDAMSRNPYLPQLFRDIFKDAFLPYRDPETLNLFLKEINSFTYEHSERLGDAFEYLLSVLGSQGAAGQFRTPRHIIDFIVAAVAPSKTDTVLDPACGTAGFLISAFKHILAQNTDTPLSPDERQRLTENFVGYDIAPEMVRLSLVNMYLHNFREPTIYEYDTLSSEQRWDDTFDLILANPPFMSPKGGIRPHARFSIQSKRSEVLFVDYIAEHLNPDGRAGVIVPEGIIFQSSNAYKALRKMLVEENYLWAVVSLPAGVFNPYSGVKTSILLMDKQLAKRSPRILFVEVKNDGYDLGAQRRAIEKNDLPEALAALQAYQADPLMDVESTLAHAVLKAKIAEEGDYNLSGGRYKNEIDLSNIIFPIYPLGEICDIYNGSTPSRNKKEYWQNGTIPWFTINDIRDKGRIINNTKQNITETALKETSVTLLPPNTLLLCCTASVGEYAITKIPLTTNQQFNGLVVKEEFKNKLLPEYLYQISSKFKSELIRISGKTSFNFVSVKLLKNIQIPLPPLEVQREIVAELDEYQTIITAARQIVESYTPRIPIDPGWQFKKICDANIKIIDGDRGNNYPKKNDFMDDGYCVFLNTKNVLENGFDFNSVMFISKERDELLRKGKVQKYDVVITTRGTIGNVGIFDNSIPYENIRINSGMLIMRPNKKNIMPEYLFLFLQSSHAKSQINKLISGAAQPQLPIRNFINLQIPIPTIKEQTIIVEKIKHEQALVDANRELIEVFEAKVERKLAEVWGE